MNVVAETVGDETTLELLGRRRGGRGGHRRGGVDPWKAGLVDDLVERAGAVLAEAGPCLRGRHFRPRSNDADGRRWLAGLGRPAQLVVVAADRPGLFSDVTGALALHGIGVLEARVHSETGQALEVFTLDLPEHADPGGSRVVADITGGGRKAPQCRRGAGAPAARPQGPARLMAAAGPGRAGDRRQRGCDQRHSRRSPGPDAPGPCTG